jgi:hypothetical protein
MTKFNDDSDSRQLLGGMPQPHGKSIKESFKGEAFPTPKWAMLTAITIDQSFGLRARTWEMPIADSIEATEARLLALALSPADEGKGLVSQTLDGIRFHEPSYYTLVIDGQDWDFCYDGKYPGFDPFIFFASKAEVVGDRVDPKPKDENWSFLNAEPVKVGGLNAVRCINFFKQPGSQDDLPPYVSSPFGFNIYLHIPLAKRLVEGPRAVIIIDPTGENQGPRPPGL